MLGWPAPLCLVSARSSREWEELLAHGARDKVRALNVQVQAARPHSGRPALLPHSRPVITEREHQHLQSYAVAHSPPWESGRPHLGRPAWPLHAAKKPGDGDVP